MPSLSYQLKGMCKSHDFGSFGTKSIRMKSLCAMPGQLKELGYKLPSVNSLKPKHIIALVEAWNGDGLTAGTIKNRMTHIRYWADNVGKSGMVQTNKEYGIENRTMYNGDKSQRLDLKKLATIDDKHIQYSLKLQSALGLRREEALKIRMRSADKGDYIKLEHSWCKGGRERTIPITTDKQRILIDEVKAFCGAGSLIRVD